MLQDGDGFLTAEELATGLKDCDIFANVDDIMQVCERDSMLQLFDSLTSPPYLSPYHPAGEHRGPAAL